MNPLCTLRYSATHADKHHMVYRLDAVDAYERRLVKQIEVASAGIEGGHNKPYVRLLGVSNRRGVITARIELDVETASGVRRREATVQDGDHLEQTAGRAVYRTAGWVKSGWRRAMSSWNCACRRGALPSYRGRHMAMWMRSPCRGDDRRTIKEHLDKEKRLRLKASRF